MQRPCTHARMDPRWENCIDSSGCRSQCRTNPPKGQNNRSPHALMEEGVNTSASHLSVQPEVIEQKLQLPVRELVSFSGSDD